MTEESHELDALAQALGRRAEQRELDERAPEWERVAAGELELDEAIECRRAAGDDEQEVGRAAAYFRPFDADETGSLVDHLLGTLGDDQGGAALVRGAEPAEAEPEANVVPLREPARGDEAGAEGTSEQTSKQELGSSGFWWIPGGMLLAAAAAILAWWFWPPSEEIRHLEDPPKVAALEPLADYVLETDGGLKRLRGDAETGTTGSEEPGELRYQRDTPFEWILRPKVDEPGEVGLRGFAFVDGGSAGLPLPALDELTQIADSGAIRISGTIEQLDLEPGRYTIALAVGRPADLPRQAAEVHQPAADAAWQVRRVDIEIED